MRDRFASNSAPSVFWRPKRRFFQPTRPWRSELFDDFIGAYEKRLWNSDAERIGSLEVDKQLELGGLLDGQVCRLCTLQYPVHIGRGAAKQVSIAWAVTHQAAFLGKSLEKVHGGQP